MQDVVVVAEGALLRIKEMKRALEERGVEGIVLSPGSGCRTG